MAAVFQSYLENILRSATWGGTTPDTSYAASTFGRMDPSTRVRYAGGAATVTATVTSARGDILVVPCTNANALTVTNGAGLNVSVPVPTMPSSRVPKTIVCDLSLLQPNASTRTSTTWSFAFTASGALQIGGAILLYSPKNEFALWGFQWGGRYGQEVFGVEQTNGYGVTYTQSFQTRRRDVTLTKLATQADLDALLEWFDDSDGRFAPCLLWPDQSVNDALFGRFAKRLEYTTVAPSSEGTIYSVSLSFEEANKGKPV